ncbi:MAG: hypothetical protein IAE97_01495 [Chthoniobacterales bacterium]|nr:hypothetical protein [Chthoniobacterales bacterium]
MDRESFYYALENTRTHVEPTGLIETFGSTVFDFVLISELMDEVNRVRLRRGTLQAERPRIVAPHHFSKILLDGFGEKAREFADWLEENGGDLQFLRYGFQFTKSDLREEVVSGNLEKIIAQASDEARTAEGSRRAVIESVDDAWEVSLLKLAVDTAKRSADGNLGEWKKRGLI